MTDDEVCDGIPHCDDGEDEDGCPVTDYVIDTTAGVANSSSECGFSCADGTGCLAIEAQCDGIEDCADGSDEGEYCPSYDIEDTGSDDYNVYPSDNEETLKGEAAYYDQEAGNENEDVYYSEELNDDEYESEWWDE